MLTIKPPLEKSGSRWAPGAGVSIQVLIKCPVPSPWGSSRNWLMPCYSRGAASPVVQSEPKLSTRVESVFSSINRWLLPGTPRTSFPNEGSFQPTRSRKLSKVYVVLFFCSGPISNSAFQISNVSRCHWLLEDFVYFRIRATKMFPRSYVRSNFNRSNFKYVCIRCIRGKCFYECKMLLRRIFREKRPRVRWMWMMLGEKFLLQ